MRAPADRRSATSARMMSSISTISSANSRAPARLAKQRIVQQENHVVMSAIARSRSALVADLFGAQPKPRRVGSYIMGNSASIAMRERSTPEPACKRLERIHQGPDFGALPRASGSATGSSDRFDASTPRQAEPAVWFAVA